MISNNFQFMNHLNHLMRDQNFSLFHIHTPQTHTSIYKEMYVYADSSMQFQWVLEPGSHELEKNFNQMVMWIPDGLKF